MQVLITGVAGFIGANAADQLLTKGHKVFGLDNLNNYYDPSLKNARLKNLSKTHNSFQFKRANIQESGILKEILKNNSIDVVIHLAAQAGVRYSLENPHAYIQANLVGFSNIIEFDV